MRAKRKVLKNGVRVVLVPMKDSETITTMVMTQAGSAVEAAEEFGLAHFLEHMMFKATKTRTSPHAIALEIETLGARTNAFTSKSYTGYYATGHKKHALKLLDIVSDVYLNPTFPEKDIEKEKGVVIEELNMYEDSPQDLADLLYDEMMYGKETGAGRPIIGTKESVTALTRDNLVAFHNKHYIAENTVVIVAGNFDEKSIQKDIQNYFGTLAGGKQKKPAKGKETGTRVAHKNKASEQSHLVLGVPALGREHKDFLIESMLVSVLGAGMSSRLFNRLREEMGVCYYIYASPNAYPGYGSITFHAGVPAGRVEEVVEALKEEMAKIATEPVPEDELKKTKNYVSGSFVLGLESSRSFAQYYAMQEIYGLELKAPNARMKEVNAIEAKDIQKLAKKLFKPEQLHLYVVGPVSDGSDSKASQKLKNLLK